MEYTEEEFCIAMARLDGFTVFDDGSGRMYDDEGNICFRVYWSDLNLLMPLAWKNKIDVRRLASGEWLVYYCLDTTKDAVNKDPVQAIRDCLWQIHKHQ